MSLQDASRVADLNRGGDPAVESEARVDCAAARVGAGGNIISQRLSTRAEGSEGLKTNGTEIHTVGKDSYLRSFCVSASSATARAELDAAGM